MVDDGRGDNGSWIKKADRKKRTVGIAQLILQQLLTKLLSSWGRLLTSLVPINFLLLAWNCSTLSFWSGSVKPKWSYFSFPLNGRDSSLLFWLALLFSFLRGQIVRSPTPFLLSLFRQTILSPFSYLPFSLGRIFLSPNSLSSLLFLD